MKKRNKGLLVVLVLIFLYMASFYFYNNVLKLSIAEEAFLGFQEKNGLRLDNNAYTFQKNKKMAWIHIVKKDDKAVDFIYNEQTETLYDTEDEYEPYYYPKARYFKAHFKIK